MNPLDDIDRRLGEIESAGLLRSRRPPLPGGTTDVSSNDYLGYAKRSVSRETTASAGAGASRLISGSQRVHERLEKTLADWVGQPDAVVFSSGYSANVGVLAAVTGPGHVIISDCLNHASIVDGCRLSRASVVVVPHLDAGAVERQLEALSSAHPCWVVTETYFSMDGDAPDLRRLRAACDAHSAALYVDEAHALGVFGPLGAGQCAAAGVKADVLVGTLGKAVGTQGAFAAGRNTLVDFLWNRARTFVFSTALSPVIAEIALHNASTIQRDSAGRDRLNHNCRLFQELFPKLTGELTGPIFPIPFGTPQRALIAAQLLADRGFTAVAIRPPTVPAGTSRLRISLSADLVDEDIRRLGQALKECLAL